MISDKQKFHKGVFSSMIPYLIFIVLSTTACQNSPAEEQSAVPSLFEEYFEVPKDRFSSVLQQWKRQKLSPEKKVQIDAMVKPMNLYQNGDYKNVVPLIEEVFEKFPDLNINNQRELRFYLGISQMVLHNFTEADHQFGQLLNLKIFKYNADLLWYQALNHLAMGQNTQCQMLLNSILEKKVEPYTQRAQTLVYALRTAK